MPDLEAQAADLDHVFRSYRNLRIPAYQREYTWTKEHAQVLLDTLVEAVEAPPDRAPFLGTLLLCGADEERSPMDVIDGQQRLVTLTILGACLRDRMSTRASLPAWAASRALALRAPDAEFFHHHVTARGATQSIFRAPDFPTTTQLHVLENLGVLRAAVNNMSAEERRALATAAGRCRIVVLRAADDDDAYQVFLSINERGQPLEVEDIFHAELIGPLAERERAHYAPIIAQIGKYRRENQTTVNRSKTFFSHLATARGWRGRAIVESVRLAIKNAGSSLSYTRNHFIPAANAYLALTGMGPLPDGLPVETVEHIEALIMLGSHGDDDWLSTGMLLLLNLEAADPALATAIAMLDRFAYGMAINGAPTKTRRERYSVLNAAIRNGDWNAAFMTMQLSSDERSKMHRTLAARLYVRDAAVCRVVLIRIDALLTGRPLSAYRGMPEYQASSPDRFNVEHIVPQGATLTREGAAAWRRDFPNDNKRRVLAQQLGNLTLATIPENEALGQAPFRDKRKVFARPDHPIGITQGLGTYDTWTEEDIAYRHEILMKAAAQIFGLDKVHPVAS